MQKLSADRPEARDEGPRLIPLGPSRGEHPRLEYFVRLADRALGETKPKKKSE